MLRTLRRTLSGLTLLNKNQSEGRLTAIRLRPVSSTDRYIALVLTTNYRREHRYQKCDRIQLIHRESCFTFRGAVRSISNVIKDGQE